MFIIQRTYFLYKIEASKQDIKLFLFHIADIPVGTPSFLFKKEELLQKNCTALLFFESKKEQGWKQLCFAGKKDSIFT